MTPPLPTEALARLPGITVRRTTITGARGVLLSHSSYQRGGWLIQVDRHADHSMTRWVVAHEIKHVLDAGLLPDQLPRLTPAQREALCDHFAACLLVPRTPLLQCWHRGQRDAMALAPVFGAPIRAVGDRLHGIGLTAPLKQGRPSYPSHGMSDTIISSDPEASKDDLASPGDAA